MTLYNVQCTWHMAHTHTYMYIHMLSFSPENLYIHVCGDSYDDVWYRGSDGISRISNCWVSAVARACAIYIRHGQLPVEYFSVSII